MHPDRRVSLFGPPSIPAVVFMALLVLVPIGLQQPLLNSDGDLARHLTHGRYMLEHHAIIRADPFSYTRPGQPFVAFEYGSQLVYAVAERIAGLPGIAVLAGILVAATYGLVAALLLRRGVDPLLAYLTTILAALIGAGHWLARPHLFSYVATVVLLDLLEREPRPVFLRFGVLFALWANLHGGFVFGLTLIGMYLIGSVGELASGADRAYWAERVRFYGKAIVVSMLATVLTPYGLSLHRYILRIFGLHYIMDNTQEFTSPDFHDPGPKFFLGALLITMVALAVSQRRPTLPRLLVLCSGTAFALLAWRNVPLYGLTALPILALHTADGWRGLPDVRGVRERFARTANAAKTLIWIAPAVTAMLALGLNRGRLGASQVIRQTFDDSVFPVAAVAHAKASGVDGHIFSEFVWNGYLEYAWPEQRIFIDGGTDFFGEDLFREYAKVRLLGPGWRDVLRRWDVSVLLVRRKSPLAREAVRDRDWQIAYCYTLAVLLRRTPPPDAIRPAEADSAEQALVTCASRVGTRPGALRLPGDGSLRGRLALGGRAASGIFLGSHGAPGGERRGEEIEPHHMPHGGRAVGPVDLLALGVRPARVGDADLPHPRARL